MKLFIHFDEKGNIVSAIRVHEMNSAFDHPFAHSDESGRVIEAEVTKELNGLQAHEIVEQYCVDTSTRSLRKTKKSAGVTKRQRVSPRQSNKG